MDDHVRSFLDDILAHPHDDAPRLIFADWIDDHADSLPAELRDRGQLIRVHYALEGLDDDDPRRPMLQTRAAALIHANYAAWTEGFDRTWHQPTFRRGFVEGLTLAGGALGEPPPAAAPVPLRRVKLSRYRSRLAAWGMADAEASRREAQDDRQAVESASLSLLSQVDELDVGDFHLPEGGDATWFATARLNRVTSLVAREESLAPAFRSPHLSRLRTLTVAGGADPAAGWRDAPVPPLVHLSLPRATPERLAAWGERVGGTLRRLTATEMGLFSGVGPALAARLEHLDLSHGRLDLDRLAADGPFPRLARLVLKTCLFRADDPWAALRPENFPALRSLNLRNGRFHHQALAELAACPLFDRLEALHLGYNRIGPEAAHAVAAVLPVGLRTLDLSWNPIGDGATGWIVLNGAAATLRLLDLSFCGLGQGSARSLARLPADAPLIALNLGTNRVGTAGLRELLASPGLGRLEALDVSNNHLNDEAADALLRWPRLRDLTLLSLHGNDLSADALERLSGAFRGLLL